MPVTLPVLEALLMVVRSRAYRLGDGFAFGVSQDSEICCGGTVPRIERIEELLVFVPPGACRRRLSGLLVRVCGLRLQVLV